MDDLERKRAVRDRLNETFVGEPINQQLIADIQASLPEGWTLTDWVVVDGELNIAVTGPAPEEMQNSPLRLVKDADA